MPTHLSFAAVSQTSGYAPAKLTDPLPGGNIHAWGQIQPGLAAVPNPPGPDGPTANVRVCTLPNSNPSRDPKTLRLQAAGEDRLMVCGVTVFHESEDPLRWERLTRYRLTLPEASAEDQKRWKVDVDLGQVARTYVLPDFDSQEWLSSPRRGLGDFDKPIQGAQYLYVDLTSSREAILTLHDSKTGKAYEFDLGQLVPDKELQSRESGARLAVLDPDKVWLHAQVVDATTGQLYTGTPLVPFSGRTLPSSLWSQNGS